MAKTKPDTVVDHLKQLIEQAKRGNAGLIVIFGRDSRSNRQTSGDPMTDGMIAEDRFGRDHWSTLVYIETRLVDTSGYVICCDARMRTDAHNRRIFMHRPPKLAHRNRFANAQIGRPCSPTRLHDGTEVVAHDDWDCIQDMVSAGYLTGDAQKYPFRGVRVSRKTTPEERRELAAFLRSTIDESGVDLGARIKLTERGFAVAAALRQHKANGGTFATFRPPPSEGGNDGTREESTG